MFPWFYNSSDFHFPFSGAVRQHISPETDWFFGSINPEVGNAEVEKEVFYETASYGKQIGIITDVLLALVDEAGSTALKANTAVKQLKEISKKVDVIKRENKKTMKNEAKRSLDKLEKNHPECLKELLKNYGAD